MTVSVFGTCVLYEKMSVSGFGVKDGNDIFCP